MLAPMGGERDYRRFFWERLGRETGLVGFRATVERLTVARLRTGFFFGAFAETISNDCWISSCNSASPPASPIVDRPADLLLAFGSSIGGCRTKT
jgi:hypothetical protein